MLDFHVSFLSHLSSQTNVDLLPVWTISDVEKLGMAKPCEDHPPAPEDLAVICYTSGTTDAPKGVMLTHENIVANFSGILHHLVSLFHYGCS